jgi:hypothetical protein
MTRVVHSPRHAFQRVITHLCWSAHDGRVLMAIAAWREGVNVCLCPPPPRWIAHSPAKTRATKLARSTVMPPSLRASMPPPPSARYISNEKTEVFSSNDLKGGPPEFFPTHACDVYSPIGLIGSILMELE